MNGFQRLSILLLLSVLLAANENALGQSGSALPALGDWQEFRGLGGRGLSSARQIPKTWINRHFAWKTSLPGRGWSSPVVSHNQVWLTTAIEHRAAESDRIQRIELLALAVDLNDGTLQHQIPLFEIADPPVLHSRNSYASPTPVIAGQRVFCSFGTMGLAAMDRTSGAVLWKNSEIQIDHETGPGSSPIVWNDLVILNYDGTDRQSIAAFDQATGQLRWQSKRSGKLSEVGMYQKAFSTPIVWDSPTGIQLISAGANWVYAYDPQDGRELWKVDYGKLGFSNVPRPLIHDGKLLVCTGYNKSTLQAFSLPTPEMPQPKLLWAVERGGPTIPSPIIAGDLLFMVSDDGIATAVDLKTGESLWTERLKGAFAASPILVEGHLWFCNDAGKVYVIKPDREFQLVATNQVEEPIMATPAAIGQDFILRTRDSLLCIRNTDPGE